MIARIAGATDRAARKALLKEIGNRPDLETARALAGWLGDPSPRVSSRVLAILAHHRLDDLFAARVEGIDRARAEHLRGSYRRLREARDRT